MDEYISRAGIIAEYDRQHQGPPGGARNIMETFPAADVRPVVLCRECVHWERYNNTAGCGYCHKVKFEYGADGYVFNPVREPDFYCADGRKADVNSYQGP